MNCQHVQENLLDYHDGKLAPELSNAIREHISSCPACQREFAAIAEIDLQMKRLPAPEVPTERMRSRFQAMLEAEGAKQMATEKPRSAVPARTPSILDRFFAHLLPSRPVHQFTCAVLLLAGGLWAGSRFFAPGPQPVAPVTVATNTTPEPAVAPDDDARRELAELREQVNNMGRLVTYSLLQQKSTSERLQNVLATLEMKNPDRQLLTDLVGTLALDPSINVRLSAVEALAPHADQDVVRAGLIAALPRETAPLVQVAMIELLTSVRDMSAAPVFDNISHDPAVDPTVRETARRAYAVLMTPISGAPERSNT